MLPHVGIDRGAIKFLLAVSPQPRHLHNVFPALSAGTTLILKGANMMAPGLLSPGGSLPDLPADSIVAIHAEGKVHACGIGKLVNSSEEIRKAGKGVAVEVLCWIG